MSDNFNETLSFIDSFRVALEENCVYLKTQDHALSQYYRLSSLPKWNGYLIRLPFYAKAYSASYIRFTSGFYPDDQNYEFGKFI